MMDTDQQRQVKDGKRTSYKDTIERPTFPTGVLTTGGISFPGIKLSDSFKVTPPLISISNKCSLLYLPATLPSLSRTR